MQDNDLLYSLFTDNHDNGWLLDRVGDPATMRYERATAIAAMVYLMRGVCFLYQGQELGMINSQHDSISEFDDVESINKYAELRETMSDAEALAKINFGGRDNARRPMCWNADGSGFTTGKPWIPFHSAMEHINLEKDLAAERSVYRFYRDLLHLRSDSKALTVGTFCALESDGSYCAFERRYEEETVLIVCNFENAQEIELIGGELLLSNYGLQEKKGAVYRPYEVAVFRR